MSRTFCVLFLALLTTAGCQPAKPYNSREPKLKALERAEAAAAANQIPENCDWMDPGREAVLPGDVRIEFVHEGTSPEEWAKLPAYWNDPTLSRAVGLLGGEGIGRAALAADKGATVIQVKVPLGLEDPTSFIPANNTPTKAKWALGRKLFYDTGWLTGGTLSCATCHMPGKAFTDGEKTTEGYNVPTLVNVVYQPRLFWDGRATYLEEVVQRNLGDEREPAHKEEFRHVWHGVIKRLRKSPAWTEDFNKTFGHTATQDAVGKAIATYLRTLLAADSVYDAAVAARQKKGAQKLTAEHFAAALDDKALESLGRDKQAKDMVAKELANGHDLFRGKAGCVKCHPAGVFSDGRFYNIGVEADAVLNDSKPRFGRFAAAPLGEKDRYLRGAYKVPTLRSLTRTMPYFHDGSAADLVKAVRFHVKPEKDGKALNLYLDPTFVGKDGRRDFGLSEQDVADLVTFLRALDGAEVDKAVCAER